MTCLFNGIFQQSEPGKNHSLFRSQGIHFSKISDNTARTIAQLGWSWQWDTSNRCGNLATDWLLDTDNGTPLSAVALAAKVRNYREETEGQELSDDAKNYIQLFNRLPEMLLAVLENAQRLALPIPPILPSGIFFKGSLDSASIVLVDLGWEPANTAYVGRLIQNKPTQFLMVSGDPQEGLVVNPTNLGLMVARVLALICAESEQDAANPEWCKNYYGKNLWRKMVAMQSPPAAGRPPHNVRGAFGRETLSLVYGTTKTPPPPPPPPPPPNWLKRFVLILIAAGAITAALWLLGIFDQPVTEQAVLVIFEEPEIDPSPETAVLLIFEDPEIDPSEANKFYEEALSLLKEDRIRNTGLALEKLDQILKIRKDLETTDQGSAIIKKTELLKQSIQK